MVDKTQIDEAIINSLHVDEEGYKEVKTLDIAGLIAMGIKDVPTFLQGVLDSENDSDFNDSSEDYVKGYSYGKTGKF